MPDRKLAVLLKDQNPLVLALKDTVQRACGCMWERRAGSVLVTDEHQRLCGIFTGRDAVRTLAQGNDPSKTPLSQAMTPDPVTLGPRALAMDALRAMNEGGFRHLPVVDEGRIWGVLSRGDFSGVELERLDEEIHLAECIW